ncbi:membrane protein YdbS, contains bPH2 (pleckstrin homology) domain [Neorhodopirellula lusitana]|uniref:Membrane protein YdbS, contains bPH2 (Pleckstrin homology) domain n=1 Tax=Neorhodopirellula lusitana TaxID=445327 RepID=A0ABY1Q112_9BACT|nr:PH domain-containing protein [Neorhodopirellula lusitana]SMP56017.1 membrane protein YdbS, contains bPH2 (pleckstrin homology) domain [Neorhodopirellula lusitana]
MNSAQSSPLSRLSFPSAIDRWLAFLLGFPVVASVALGIGLIAMGRPGDAWTLFGVAAFTGFITAIFTLPCRYTLLEDAVSVRCGVICYQIPYESILDVKKSRTWLSGPALSLKRVVIQTAKKQHILSPADRDDFINQVQQRCPALRS